MRIEFVVSPDESQRARQFFASMRSHPFVRARRRRNVRRERARVTRGQFWEAQLCAQVTTQQRSGPGSAVYRLVSMKPFPLTLRKCQGQHDVEGYIRTQIQDFGGIRRGVTIAREASKNLQWLSSGGWSLILPKIKKLECRDTQARERDAARCLAEHIRGLGPKQARNTLQMLGLTRYETPIDSRITKWLNDFGFPIHLSGSALSDPAYYELVSGGFQRLCFEAGVLPCLMDAAIFAAVDKDDWHDEPVRW